MQFKLVLVSILSVGTTCRGMKSLNDICFNFCQIYRDKFVLKTDHGCFTIYTFQITLYIGIFLEKVMQYKLCLRNSPKFDVRKSVHHHTIQTNQPTRCSSFTSLLLDVYVWLNMFRAPPRPSSGAYNCSRSLWFYRLSMTVGALLVVVWQTCQTTTNKAPTATLQPPRSNRHAPTAKLQPPRSNRHAPTATLQPSSSNRQAPTATLQPPRSNRQAPTATLQPPRSNRQAPTATLQR
jgi:hypothetical protein